MLSFKCHKICLVSLWLFKNNDNYRVSRRKLQKVIRWWERKFREKFISSICFKDHKFLPIFNCPVYWILTIFGDFVAIFSKLNLTFTQTDHAIYSLTNCLRSCYQVWIVNFYVTRIPWSHQYIQKRQSVVNYPVALLTTLSGSVRPDENSLPKPSQGRVIPRWNRLDKRNWFMKKIPLRVSGPPQHAKTRSVHYISILKTRFGAIKILS